MIKRRIFFTTLFMISLCCSALYAIPYQIFYLKSKFTAVDNTQVEALRQFSASLGSSDVNNAFLNSKLLFEYSRESLWTNGVVAQFIDKAPQPADYLTMLIFSFSIKSTLNDELSGTDCSLRSLAGGKKKVISVIAELPLLCAKSPVKLNCLTESQLISKAYQVFESDKNICGSDPALIKWEALHEEY